MSRLLRDPLIHFLLLGALLFVLHGILNQQEENTEGYDIVLTDSDVERLVQAYQRNWNSLPDSLTLQNLMAAEVKAEIFYREALRMNLDHNDEIIRRRLKQKYEFLVKDLTTPQNVTEEILRQFYTENPSKYKNTPTITFHQFYFHPDKRKNPSEDAENAWQKIKDKDIETVGKQKIGDGFHLQSYHAAKDIDQVRQSFGQEFATALFEAATGKKETWLAPISSGFGVHLVFLEELEVSELMPFEEVKDKVAEDWKLAQQTDYQEQLYQNLQQKYQVTYQLEKWK